jgi:DHA2 family multidrug resistance protein
MSGSEEPKADAAAWTAVAAGTLGAMMATLDISIVNASLPVIQGEIGASGTEGTWIATAYLVAEIVMIPMAGWLVKMLGLRKLLMFAAGFFTLFSVLCGLSTSLPMMIAGRVGQGFTGGALIPTAMTIIATRLPRSQQPLGNAMFGATAILGPVMGPVLGGWLTENLSWHYSFFINLPIGAALFALLFVGVPAEKMKSGMLQDADWFGIAGLVFGLGALTVVLEDGQRELWFASAEIRWLAVTSLIGFILLGWGQLHARSPIIQLKLLRDPQFGAVVAMAAVVGMGLYGTSYVIPQFLSGIANYNSLQAGQIVLLSGVPMLFMMPFVPAMIKHLDIRIAVGSGLLLLACSCYLNTGLTALSTGSAFIPSQLLSGVGTVTAMMFLNQAAIRSVTAEQAGDASGLYNVARNLGGSIALALITIIQERRSWLHARRLEESLSANAEHVQSYIAGQGGMDTALRSLEGTIQIQALTMTYADLFWMLSIGLVCITPLVLFLRPLPTNAAPVQAH